MIRFNWLNGLLLLIILPGIAAAVDCRQGADYYCRAKSETDPQQVIAWLHRSVEVCPNFNAWYMLGLIYTQQEEMEPAIAAFSRARAQAVSSATEALALARQGELLARSGYLSRALQALKLAERFHPAPVPA